MRLSGHAEMTSVEAGRVSWRELYVDGHVARFTILCLGVWLHAADSMLVATLLPSAVDEIGGARFVSWTIALYQLGAIVTGAATGLLVVRFGLRSAMLGATFVYAVGCVLSAASAP